LHSAQVRAFAVQPDGKIVAAGMATVAQPDQTFALARYHSNGNLDASFGTGGRVTTRTSPPGLRSVIKAVAVLPDGKIVAAGYEYHPTKYTNYTALLARYQANGALDSSFGTDGMVRIAIGTAQAVKLQADGKILVAGGAISAEVGTGGFALARFHANGTLDTHFGEQGMTVIRSGGLVCAAALQLLPDGTALASGSAKVDGRYHFALAHYLANGNLDHSFGTNGSLITRIGELATPHASVLLKDGLLVLAGSGRADAKDTQRSFLAALYALKGKGATPTTAPPLQSQTEAYGVFLAGNDLFVGQKKVLGALRRCDIRGWGSSKDVLGETEFRDVLNKQLPTAADAKAAYLENMISGSEHPRSIGLGPVAKFHFDGGAKEHCVENAFKFLK
jgi:uncharacterized delta-60 repeat protein